MSLYHNFSVLIYARREGKVLLMHRNKEPNLGLWTAPGGKIESGESPHETARREMAEETGLEVGDLYLRGICTLVSPLQEWSWYLFVFVTTRFQGTLKADEREGNLAWVPLVAALRQLRHCCPSDSSLVRVLPGSRGRSEL